MYEITLFTLIKDINQKTLIKITCMIKVNHTGDFY